jgi:hypothetical protein
MYDEAAANSGLFQNLAGGLLMVRPCGLFCGRTLAFGTKLRPCIVFGGVTPAELSNVGA